MTALKVIPFVTGLPDDGQKSITWVRNGELLEGATTKKGHDGVLNAAGVQIQENVVVLDENLRLISGTLDVSNEKIEKIEEILAVTGNLDLVEQVKKNTESIEGINFHLEQTDERVEQIGADSSQLVLDVGTRTISSGTRTIFDDLVFVKSTLGQNTGEDINGNTVPGNEATGLTRKVLDVTKQSLQNKDDVAIVSALVESADLPQLIANDAQIRAELGTKPVDPNVPPIYFRINTLENSHIENKDKIAEISTEIGLGTRHIGTEVTSNTSRILALEGTINTPSTGLKPRVGVLEATIATPGTGLSDRVAKNTLDISTINTKIDTELTTNIKNVSDFVGYGTVPAPKTSLAGKLDTLTALHNDTAASVQDLQVEIGNNSSGMKADIKKLQDSVAAQALEIKAIDARLKLVEDKVANL